MWLKRLENVSELPESFAGSADDAVVTLTTWTAGGDCTLPVIVVAGLLVLSQGIHDRQLRHVDGVLEVKKEWSDWTWRPHG